MRDNTQPEVQPPQKQSGGYINAIGIALLITAAEAFGLQWVWEHVLVATFHIPNLEFGQMFAILFILKIVFRNIFELGDMHDTVEDTMAILEESKKILQETRDIQVFAEQNRTFQFQSQMRILGELVKERDNEIRELNERSV